MEKITILDHIGISSTGAIELLFAKQIREGSNVLASEWHRTLIDKGGDIEQQIDAVNNHLVSGLGYPAVASIDIERIERIAKTAWAE